MSKPNDYNMNPDAITPEQQKTAQAAVDARTADAMAARTKPSNDTAPDQGKANDAARAAQQNAAAARPGHTPTQAEIVAKSSANVDGVYAEASPDMANALIDSMPGVFGPVGGAK